MAEVAPFAAAGDLPTPITIKTAILMTLRNEDPARAILRLRTVKASVDATGEGRQFELFHPERHQRSRRRRGRGGSRRRLDRPTIGDGGRIVYRRRTDNTGFKAGNVARFLRALGRATTS